jgi:hypothetical protein
MKWKIEREGKGRKNESLGIRMSGVSVTGKRFAAFNCGFNFARGWWRVKQWWQRWPVESTLSCYQHPHDMKGREENRKENESLRERMRSSGSVAGEGFAGINHDFNTARGCWRVKRWQGWPVE